jgi:phosphoribosyl 1,2-cyclic phosphodiesterase
MMEIRVLNSGSDGNGYAIILSEKILLIECGVPSKVMLKHIDFRISDVEGCIISHGHKDHLGHANEYKKYGFRMYMTEESMPENAPKYMFETIKRMKKNRIGGFEIIPFKVPHNETECDGFVILHPEIGTLVFITDAEMCPYNLSGINVNHLMIECNYSNKYLDIDSENRSHVLLGHMEFETCKRFIRSINSDKLQSIGLIHLSKKNIDPDEIYAEISEEFSDKKVWIADRGTRVKL